MELIQCMAAKSNRSDKIEWLPFTVHALDTEGIIRRLFNNWLPDHVRDVLSKDLYKDLDTESAYEKTEKICRLLALLHDIGKVTPAFQSKITGSIEGHSDLLMKKGIEITHLSEIGKSPHQLAGQAILEDYGFQNKFSVIVGSHHGRCAYDKSENQLDIYFENYYGRRSVQKNLWRGLWSEWITASLNKLGFKLNELPSPSVKSQMLLTGLVIMADWIASNTRYFPYVEFDVVPDDKACKERVQFAWDILGLPQMLELQDPCFTAEAFSERFGFYPNTTQEQVMETVSKITNPGLFIIEAPMGLGKTEAALATAEILIEQCGAGGIYFGLPTQATANGIFGRICEWASKCDEEMHSIRLAHGMTELNEEYQALFHGTAEDSGDGNMIIHEWFEGRKQALLSDFVIATVDQFLLASLKQGHVMLRHLGLVGKVVIIDECHAYDAYMNVYLDRTLTWMGAYNVPVIVLSATLPPKRREELICAYLNKPKKLGVEIEKISDSYPCLTYTEKERVIQKALQYEILEKQVKVQEINEYNLQEYLLQKLCEGGCGAVIVNSVSFAQLLAEKLRTQLAEYEVCCFHSRFIAEDRAKIEKSLLKRVGKHSTSSSRNKLIVVGTQVLEQSLDLDFDVMVTELCPMDLLLQRIGRLHRHRRERPIICCNPELAVLKPEKPKRSVYNDWILEQTQRFLPDTLNVPSCIPKLVREVYAEPQELTEKYRKYCDEINKKEFNANKYCIKSNMLKNSYKSLITQFIDDEPGNSAQAEASVRDTDETFEVLVLKISNEPTKYKLVSGEYSFDVTAELDENENCIIARQRIRLPALFSKPNNWNAVHKALDIMPKRWQNAKLLKGELLLLLNDNMETELIGRKLYYSNEYGLKLCD